MSTRTLTCLSLLATAFALHACGAADTPPSPAGKAVPPDLDLNRAEAQPASVGYFLDGEAQPGMVTLSRERGFTGRAIQGFRGQRVTVNLRGTPDAYLWVYGPKRDGMWGRPIARDDDSDGRNARLTVTLPETGEYRVVSTSYPTALAGRPTDQGQLTLTVDLGLERAPNLGAMGGAAPTVRVIHEGLRKPTALAFHPTIPTQLWITGWDTDSFTMLDLAGAAPETPTTILDRSYHFLYRPTSLAFASDGTMGTCHENANDYRGRAAPNDFMGPVINPADFDTLRRLTPTRAHLDMLHHSPWCMGLATREPRVFWAFNGQSGSIDKYEFHEWHAPGGDDHADGRTWRFANGELRRVEMVPSHMAFEPGTPLLYVADTGNSRVVRLDTSLETNESMPRVRTRITETPLYSAEGAAALEEVVGASAGLQRPSGLIFHTGLLYVSDNATGTVSAFTRDGQLVRSVDTGAGAGAIQGIAVGPEGMIYAVDYTMGRVLRIEP